MTEELKTDIIINRDALFALRELPDESVNCCVTSPPYYALRDYGLDAQIGREDTPEEYIERLVAVFHELKRVLRSDEEPERQERTADRKKCPRSRLQAKGFNRYSVAFSLCPTR